MQSRRCRADRGLSTIRKGGRTRRIDVIELKADETLTAPVTTPHLVITRSIATNPQLSTAWTTLDITYVPIDVALRYPPSRLKQAIAEATANAAAASVGGQVTHIMDHAPAISALSRDRRTGVVRRSCARRCPSSSAKSRIGAMLSSSRKSTNFSIVTTVKAWPTIERSPRKFLAGIGHRFPPHQSSGSSPLVIVALLFVS